MKLWLDDTRPAPDGWIWCQTVKAAKVLILGGEVEESSLDHDLGQNQPTGYDLCKWMAQTGNWPKKKPNVHSANPVGAQRMRGVISRYFPL